MEKHFSKLIFFLLSTIRIADIINMPSPNYLNEIITSVMGVSAKQYIQNKVIDEAKRLLAYTDAPISDIAFELHFSTVSYFIRLFRQHTGETPLLYRKKYKP